MRDIYGLSRKQVEKMVYQKTPMDTIYTINEYNNCFEVHGAAGGDNLTYRFYTNGEVVEK